MRKYLLGVAGAAFISLTAAACGGSDSASDSDKASSDAPAYSTDVTLEDFKIAPEAVSATAGTNEFKLTNIGDAPHNLAIRDSSNKTIAKSDDLTNEETSVLEADLKSGSYVIYCGIAGHESLGMRGTLEVK